MGIIWFATGMHWAFSLGYIGMGIIADLVAGAGHYRNKAINLLSYMLISLGGIYTYVVFFIDRRAGPAPCWITARSSPTLTP